jgi:transposase
LLANRKLLKRKLIDIENHIRGALRAFGLLVGAIARGAYETCIRELLERSDPIFAMTIEAMLDVRPAIFEGYVRLHRVLLQVVQHDPVCRRLMTFPASGLLQLFRSKLMSMIPDALRGLERLERILA